MITKNFGIDLDKQKANHEWPTNYQFGAVVKDVLRPDSDWTSFTPECEIQKSDVVDYMDCVTEASINAIDILCQLKFNLVLNLSQRFSAKMDGTTESGNDLYSVGNSLRNDGFVYEIDWKRDKSMDWNTYYANIPSTVKGKGQKVLIQFDINYENVGCSRKEIRQALKYGPVVVIGHAWELGDDGMYHSHHLAPNHAFLLVKINDDNSCVIFDSYPTDFMIDDNATKQEFTKVLAPDFEINYAMLYSIKLKTTDQRKWYIKLMTQLKKVFRDIHGAIFFFKPVNGGIGYQEIKTVNDIKGWLVDEFGVEKNNVSDAEKAKYVPWKFFGN